MAHDLLALLDIRNFAVSFLCGSDKPVDAKPFFTGGGATGKQPETIDQTSIE
jgi:hypothetical protein